MGKITLYGIDLSPPVRACLLTLKALNLPFEYKEVNLLKKEQNSKEFLEKNPQHTVPTLEIDGHYIWDSHAIMAYLVSKYGKNDSLYPKDLLKRAVVDQRLHFESGVVFQGCLRNITVFLFFKNDPSIPQHKIDAIYEAYDFVESFLKSNPYIAGPEMTIADFSLISTITTLPAFAKIDPAKYPKMSAWIERMKKLPYYEEANGKGNEKLISFIQTKNYKIVQ